MLDKALVKKVQSLREQGLSYQRVVGLFNLWRIETRSENGKWYGKTIPELLASIASKSNNTSS